MLVARIGEYEKESGFRALKEATRHSFIYARSRLDDPQFETVTATFSAAALQAHSSGFEVQFSAGEIETGEGKTTG